MSKQRRLERFAMDLAKVERSVAALQRELGVTDDGDPGPVTLGAMGGGGASTFGPAVLAAAIAELGNGEEHVNNGGPHVARYQGERFCLSKIARSYGYWCAGFTATMIEDAAKSLGLPCPVARSSWARTLFARCLKAGRAVNIPQPGDIGLMERGEPGGSSHIFVVEHYHGDHFHTIEGNVGAFPAKVKRLRHRMDDDDLIGFARLP